MEEYDSIIIGCGMAGMTASIYLKRENLNIILIESEMIGGQMIKSPLIENYPGYKKIDGSTLALEIYNQLQNLKVVIKYETVLKIEDCIHYKIIHTNQTTYKTKTIVLATGREPRKLNLPNEEKLIGKGISYCATCDGSFFKNKEVAVMGGGNSAVIESLFLANICKKVTLIYRKQELRSESTLKDRLKNQKNIEILYETTINSLIEEKGYLKSLSLTNGNKINVDGLFIYIGFEPKTNYLKQLIQTKNNYIVVDSKMRTNIDGIYACGDCIYKDVYQLTTAVGEATIAAEEVKKYLLLQKN